MSQKKYTNSILFFISFFIGYLYTNYLFGTKIIPTNDEWLLTQIADLRDMTQAYLGWVFFRFDDWHWPLTLTDNIAYPFKTSIGYTDSIPLFAIFFKLFSSFLPTNFQYIGLFFLCNFTLQFFWGAKLANLFLSNSYFAAISWGTLFTIAPPLTSRITHIALTSHWLILAAIWSYFSSIVKLQVKKILIFQFILIFISSGIHPYLSAMTFLIIIVSHLQLYLNGKIKLNLALIGSGTTLFTLIIGWYIFGYFTSKNSIGNQGFGLYSTNLNSFINPLDSSLFIKGLPQQPYQYEGYNYLGLGILLLCSIAFFKWLLTSRKISPLIINNKLAILLVCLLFLFAISNKIYLGETRLLAYNLPFPIEKIFNIFRASGRFIWVCHYVIVFAILLTTFKVWQRQYLYFILPIIISLQFIDFIPKHRSIISLPDRVQNERLVSQQWQKLDLEHNKLIVIPASQCSDPANFPLFEILAAEQKMQTNTMYLARYDREAYNYHCDRLPKLIKEKELEKDAVYILDKKEHFNLANKINEDTKNTHYCSELDGFIVCRER